MDLSFLLIIIFTLVLSVAELLAGEMGRRKIDIEYVKRKSSRLVTFSKRRKGLFNKAKELAILCGAEVAVVVSSSSGNLFSFGMPSVEAVIKRFLPLEFELGCGRGVCSSMDAATTKLNQELADMKKKLKDEKKKGKRLYKVLKENKLTNFKFPFDGLNFAELQKMKNSLEVLRDNLAEMEASSSLLLLAKKPMKVAKVA